MPRTARLDFPGATHHVMVRGIERRRIFLDDEDRLTFLERLTLVLAEADARCFAIALMPNHYHLLLETGNTPLSRVLHRLGTCHAGDFNRRHGRCGHLYQNRFLSKPVNDEAGFMEVLRYVHLNPVRGRIVADLRALAVWPWTGHAALLGNRTAPFLEAREVLSYFGDRLPEARRELVRWMAEGVKGGAQLDEAAQRWPDAPLPAPDGKWRDPEALDRASARAALESEGWDLDRVIRVVCHRLGAPEGLLRSGRRTAPVSRAREVVAWLAAERLGTSRTAIARATGVSHQAVTRALDRASRGIPSLRERFPELVA